MVKQFVVFITEIILLSGCVMQNKTVELTNEFDRSEVEFIKHDGKNTINGNGFLRQMNGSVVTCAGSAVRLIPVTLYSKERMAHIYNSNDYGFSPFNNEIQFIPSNSDYNVYERRAQCDSNGRFSFKNVPDGEYFAITVVGWQAPSGLQGGAIMKRVQVHNGEIKDIILTSN